MLSQEPEHYIPLPYTTKILTTPSVIVNQSCCPPLLTLLTSNVPNYAQEDFKHEDNFFSKCQLPHLSTETETNLITNSSKLTLLDKQHFYSKQRQISLLYLISLQCFCWVGRRYGCVEFCLWLTQKCNRVPVGLIALLHLPICLHSFIQNIMVIGSLWGQEEKKSLYHFKICSV